MTASPLDLVGCWTLERTIDDRHTGVPCLVHGTLELTEEPDGRMRWHESGTMVREGQHVPVVRTLFVAPRADGWMVTFEDGREFHPWRPAETVEHPCGRDLYRGFLDLETRRGPDRGSWSITWTVIGPAKDYTMVTRLD